jgi:pantoate--beta-alanine ligase
MGALHAGHISLIEHSKKETDLTICSIFVNPTQFNDKSDLEKYPRPIEKDIDLLINAGCDALFLPDYEDVYPENFDFDASVDLEGLDLTMEGAHRPGHFHGVVQVVRRFLDIVKPDKLYMGQKDFQQFTIIGHVIEKLDLPVDLVVCPILREPDGLAMSSRNIRLNEDARNLAPVIYKTLSEARANYLAGMSVAEVKKQALDSLNIPGVTVDYFSIIDTKTLQEVEEKGFNPIAALTTVNIGGVRLLDNMIFL